MEIPITGSCEKRSSSFATNSFQDAFREKHTRPTFLQNQHTHRIISETYFKQEPIDFSMAWFNALGSTLLISIIPLFLILLIPVTTGNVDRQPLLRNLLSFAAGGLLGDAFLHLIPQAAPSDEHFAILAQLSPGGSGRKRSEVGGIIGMWVLAGILSFLFVEKFIRLFGNMCTLPASDGKPKKKPAIILIEPPSPAEAKQCVVSHCSNAEVVASEITGLDDLLEYPDSQEAGDHPAITPASFYATGCWEIAREIQVSGFLNLASDFVHNLTDGLALGASFLAGGSMGWVTALSILLHEIPHELATFALLVHSGCSKTTAVALQLVTTLGAMGGCLLGLITSGTGGSNPELNGNVSWGLAFTAGGFIYVSTVIIIPEVLSQTSAWQSVKEVFWILLGLGVMVFIQYFN